MRQLTLVQQAREATPLSKLYDNEPVKRDSLAESLKRARKEMQKAKCCKCKAQPIRYTVPYIDGGKHNMVWRRRYYCSKCYGHN